MATNDAKVQFKAETAEFTSAINSAKTTISGLNAELKLVDTQMKANGTSTGDLQTKLSTLEQKSEALKNEEDALNQKLEKAVEIYGEDSKEAQTLQNQLTRVQAEEIKVEAEINKTNQQIEAQTKAEQEAQSQIGQLTKKIDDEEAKLKELQEQYKNVVLEEGQDSEAAKELQSEITNLNGTLEEDRKKLADVEEAAESLTKEQQTEKSASEQLKDTIEGQEQELADLKEQYTNVVIEEGKDSEAAKELEGKIGEVNTQLKDNKEKLGEAEKAAEDLTKDEKELGEEGEEAGDKMTDGFEAASEAITAAGLIEASKKLAEALEACIDAAAGFEAQMSTVEALSGANADEMEQLSAKAKEMGATMAFSATEAGEAMEYMALAGWDADEMTDGLEGVMNLASAAGEDLGTTCDIVTDALTAFGLSASDSAHFSDVLAAASSNSNTTVSQLGEAFKMVGSTAGTLHYSIDDVSAALGLMANNGIKGSSAGTQLATTLTRMAGTNASATAEMDKLGVSMFDTATGSAKPLTEFLTELRDALKENYDNDQDLQVALYNLGGQRGMKGLGAIVNTTDEDFDSLTGSIGECEGAAETMAETKLDNFQGSVTLLESAFDALKTTMGEGILDALTEMVGWVTTLTTSVNDFLSEHENLTTFLDVLAVGLIAGGAAMGVMAVATNELGNKIKQLTVALLTCPLTWLVAGLAAAAAALVVLIAKLSSSDEALNTVKDDVKDLGDATDELKEGWEETEATVDNLTGSYDEQVARLEELAANANRSTSEQAEMENIITSLNDSIGEETIMYDENTDSLNLNNEQLEQLMETQGHTDEYTALLNEQKEAMDQVAETEGVVQEAEDALAEAQENGQMNVWRYQNQVNKANDELLQQKAVLEEVNEKLDEYGEEVEDTTNNEEIVQSAVQDMCTQIQALDEEYQNAYDAAYDSLSGQFSLWDEAAEIIPASAEEVRNAVDSQTSNLETYTAQMKELMESDIAGMDDYVAHYSDGSEESMKAIATMAEADEADRQAMMDSFQKWSDAADDASDTAAEAQTGYSEAVSDVVQEIVDDYGALEDVDLHDVGLETMEGYVGGVEDEEGNVTDTVEGIGTKAIDIFNEACGTASPSKFTEETGVNTMVGFENGVVDEANNIYKQMGVTADGAIDSFEDNANDKSLVGSGQDTMSGYESGIDSKAKETYNTMSDLAGNSIQTFEDNSNSKTLQGSGSDTVTGYIKGVESEDKNAQRKMTETAGDAIKAYEGNANSKSLDSSGSDTITGFMNGTQGKVGTLLQNMTDHAKSAIQNFKNMADGQSLYNAGSDTITGAINGANSQGVNFSTTLGNIATNAFQRFKNALGVSSPSWMAEETLEDFGEGAVIGVENSAKDLNSAMSGLAGGATDAFNSSMGVADMSVNTDVNATMQDHLETIVSDYINGLAGQIMDMADEIASRPIYVQINGKTFATATAGDMDNALGTRSNLIQRGLSL